MVENSTYGTDKSDVLKYLIDGGHNPIGISIMACEETFIFQTKEESSAAHKFINMPESPWGNEGWFYAIEDDGEWPWEKARKDYVDRCYKGNENNAPKVYWLKK
jgi:fructose-1,6-bisphosphatase